MKIDKLKKYETKIESPITENEHRANVADMISLLMPIVEKVQKLPRVPVKESLSELIQQIKDGSIKRQPTIIVGDEKTTVRASDSHTFIDTGGGENSEKLSGASTKFDLSELATLEKLNAEISKR